MRSPLQLRLTQNDTFSDALSTKKGRGLRRTHNSTEDLLMNLTEKMAGLCPECAAEAVLALEFAPSTELDCSVTWCSHRQMAAHFICDKDKVRMFFLFPAESREQAKTQASNLLDSFGLAALARAIDLPGLVERHWQAASQGDTH